MLWLKGADITEIRHAHGMNLREFAQFVGVAGATVSRWEADKRRPKYKMMERLNELRARAVRKLKEKVTA